LLCFALLCFALLCFALLWTYLSVPARVSRPIAMGNPNNPPTRLFRFVFLPSRNHNILPQLPSTPSSNNSLRDSQIHCEPSKLKRSEIHPTSSPPICRVIKKEHERGREAETMCSPNLVKEPAIKTVILSDDTAPKTEPVRCARERETQN
jgi:hypothetical protein